MTKTVGEYKSIWKVDVVFCTGALAGPKRPYDINFQRNAAKSRRHLRTAFAEVTE